MRGRVSWRRGPRVRRSGWAGAPCASGQRVLAGSCCVARIVAGTVAWAGVARGGPPA